MWLDSEPERSGFDHFDDGQQALASIADGLSDAPLRPIPTILSAGQEDALIKSLACRLFIPGSEARTATMLGLQDVSDKQDTVRPYG